MTTVLYYTDSRLDVAFASLMRQWLIRAADGKPVVAVSQAPISEWPDAIVMGDLGHSYGAMFAQIVAGLEAVTTEIVAFCEHDCAYTSEHLAFEPPDDACWYNLHHWFLEWADGPRRGRYTFMRRRALSNLITRTQTALEAFRAKQWAWDHLDALDGLEADGTPVDAALIAKTVRCEPGVRDNRVLYDRIRERFLTLGVDIGSRTGPTFWTEAPNLDIRHGGNLSGPRHARQTRHDLPPWGTLADVARGPA